MKVGVCFFRKCESDAVTSLGRSNLTKKGWKRIKKKKEEHKL